MKKKILLPLAFASLGVAVLAGCTPVSTTSPAPTSLEQEVVSSALLTRQSSNPALLMKKRENTSAAPSLSFDANDVPSTLASFDALSLENYTIKTTTLTSDKEGYDHKDEIVYSLPDGTSDSIILYYGESKVVAVDASAETSADTTTDGQADERAELHLYGYRHGGFEGMLQAGWSFKDVEDESNVAYSGTWKNGIAYIGESEYRFHAEEVTLTKNGVKATSTSFGLFAQGSFLAVEQAEVTNGSEMANVYAYTSFQNASYTRYLLAENSAARRLVYRTPSSKLVINRYQESGETLYSVHLKVVGSMTLVGVYQKVVTTSSDGIESVSYVLYQNEKNVPSEN